MTGESSLAKCSYCTFAVSTLLTSHSLSRFSARFAEPKQHFCTLIKKFPINPILALIFPFTTDSPVLALQDFHPGRVMTHFSPLSNANHPHFHLLTLLLRHSWFPFSPVLSSQIPLYAGHTTLPAPSHPAVSQSKPFPPLTLFSSSFCFSSHSSPYPSALPPLTSAVLIFLSIPFHLSPRQRRFTCSLISYHRPTDIHPVVTPTTKLAEHFFLTPLITFCYKHILKSPLQRHSALTTQILHFTLFQYVTQPIHIPPLLLTGGVSHLSTANRDSAPFATKTTSVIPEVNSGVHVVKCTINMLINVHKINSNE